VLVKVLLDLEGHLAAVVHLDKDRVEQAGETVREADVDDRPAQPVYDAVRRGGR
jgi:hypothetical protein